jgi:hypothetical protein
MLTGGLHPPPAGGLQDKEHLIDCALASAHIPWFMDGRGSAQLDGRRCIDGSFCYIFFR